MTKGTIGLNAGTIRNLLLDGGCWSLEELKKATSLCEADLWSAIGWLARENMIQITSAKSQIAFCPFFIFTGIKYLQPHYHRHSERVPDSITGI